MSTKIQIPLNKRGIVSVSGEDTREFLQGLITNDIEKVSETQTIYAALLTPQGKLLHDFFIVKYKNLFLLECENAGIPNLISRLSTYRLRAKVNITDETNKFAVSASFKPDSEELLGKVGSTAILSDGVSFIDPRHKALGERTIRLIDGNKSLESGVTVLNKNLEAYETLRIMLGVPDSFIDLVPEKSMPLEVGFDELNGVDFEKGCYVGQEVTARMKHRNLVKRRLFPIEFDGALSPGAVVKGGEIDVGTIYSVMSGRGLALLRLEAVTKDRLWADGIQIKPRKPGWMTV
ncbi:MAG: folate-binding protein [Pseudomonadota bacterium]|nr:hypothetical protein [Alphaproteobacteria bacterium]MEC7943076.1 folate-binding protein [Pseudomonadota bacterium]MEC8726900.1 folate-binding protein [Pseudomonadota bacterium]MEC9207922.1 folate-binding protein [Pseudomonadota bacterium]